jgi:hypothetical protein
LKNWGEIIVKKKTKKKGTIKLMVPEIKASKIKFHRDLKCMPFENLRTEILENKIDLTVVDLNISKVISSLDFGEELEIFQLDEHMLNLISFIENGHTLIPPFIINIEGEKWSIFDGKHRIALCFKLNIETIPFLLRKRDLKNIESLID